MAPPPYDRTTQWNTTGFLRLGRLGGAPIFFHWTLPVGLYLLSGMRFRPGYWLAGTLLILAHELGHAWLARRYGARVTAIKVMPVGGLCEYVGDLTEVEHSKVAWGGVIAQAMVYALTLVVLAVAGTPSQPWAADAVLALTEGNTFLIALNLMPVRPLDGYDAWRLLQNWLQRAAQQTELAKIQKQTAAMRQRGARVSELHEEPKSAPEPAEDAPVNDEARALAERMWAEAREREGR